MALSDLLRAPVTATADASATTVTPVAAPAPTPATAPAGATGILPPSVAAKRWDGKTPDESTRPDAEVKAERDAVALVAAAEAVSGVFPKAEAVAAAVAPVVDKPKRTRKPKAEITETEIRAASAPPVAAPAVGPIGTEGVPAASPGLVLLIDCTAIAGMAPPVLLDHVVEDYSKAIRETAQVGDIGLIDYGKGYKILAAELRRNPPKGVFLARTGSPAIDAAVDALLPLANVVFRRLS